jgi:hypothetical protein
MDRGELLKTFVDLYRKDHDNASQADIDDYFERAAQWDLASVIESGGVVSFPHARLHDCGHQVAAAANAVLDSGADTCVFVSVLHSSSQDMEDARVAVAAGAPASEFESWGIQGPGIDGRTDWTKDHAPTSFRFFIEHAAKRRGVPTPRVLERFPYLAGGRPDLLPGIDALAAECENAAVVTTADPVHHGIGYGDAPEDSLAPEAGGYEMAHESIMAGCQLLERQDYWGYNQHCVTAKSDHRDAGQVLALLRGSMSGEVLELLACEFGDVYEAPPPSWVASPLIVYRRI